MLLDDLSLKYKEFLSNLGIGNNLRWDFPLAKSKKHSYDKQTENLLNNIAFSFFEYSSKVKLYKKIQKGKLSDKTAIDVFFLMIEDFESSQKKYPINKILIEKFVDYFIEWIQIVDKKITKKNINQVLKKVHSENQIFWFYLIKKLYEQGYYKETLLIIEHKRELFTNGYFLEDVVLKEIECIRQFSNNYLNDSKMLERLCSLSQYLTNYKYTLILLKLECALLAKDKTNYEKLIKKNLIDIKDFSILEILNIYELSILIGSHRAMGKIYMLLLDNDIGLYDDFNEYTILTLLEALRNGNLDEFEELRNEFEINDNYDFKHIDWYFKNR